MGEHVEVGTHPPHLLVDGNGIAEGDQPQPVGVDDHRVQHVVGARERDERRVAQRRPDLVDLDHVAHHTAAGAAPATSSYPGLQFVAFLDELAVGLVVLLGLPQRSTVWRSSASSCAASGSSGGRTAGSRLATARARSADSSTRSARPESSATDRSRSARRRPCTAAAVARSMLPKLAW